MPPHEARTRWLAVRRDRGYNGHIMQTTVGIRELKDRLSYFLRCVQEGHDVVITDHGRPVALLRPVSGDLPTESEEQHLAALSARGLLRLGRGLEVRVPRGKPGPSLSEAVIQERAEGR